MLLRFGPTEKEEQVCFGNLGIDAAPIIPVVMTGPSSMPRSGMFEPWRAYFSSPLLNFTIVLAFESIATRREPWAQTLPGKLHYP